jgi:hypothetical protein
MFSFPNLLLFIFSVIGLTNIIVDPATIMQPVRDFIEKNCHPWINKLVSCYQCSGTWVGFLCGYILISKDLFVVFMCGMAGSFLSTLSATYLNYLEARSIIGVEEDE